MRVLFRCRLTVFLAAFGIAQSGALAGSKTNPPPPARPAPARPSSVPQMRVPGGVYPGGYGNAGVYVPGGANVHVPGGNVPGNAAGNVHIPGSLTAGGNTPAVHVPGGLARTPPVSRYGNVNRAAAPGHLAQHVTAARENGSGPVSRPARIADTAKRAVPSHVTPQTVRQPVAAHTLLGGTHLATAVLRPETHLPGTGAIVHPPARPLPPANVRGVPHTLPPEEVSRPYLQPDPHRDVASDRAFVATHAAAFHPGSVRALSVERHADWARGAWRNEWHYGRRGWWWEVDGIWYGYPMPVFPYPVEVEPLVVYETPVYDGPDLTAVETGGAGPAAMPLAGAATDRTQVGAAPPADAGTPGDPAQAPGATAPAGTGANGPPPQPSAYAALISPPPTSPDIIAYASSIPPLPPTDMGAYRCVQPTGYFPQLPACEDDYGWRFEKLQR